MEYFFLTSLSRGSGLSKALGRPPSLYHPPGSATFFLSFDRLDLNLSQLRFSFFSGLDPSPRSLRELCSEKEESLRLQQGTGSYEAGGGDREGVLPDGVTSRTGSDDHQSERHPGRAAKVFTSLEWLRPSLPFVAVRVAVGSAALAVIHTIEFVFSAMQLERERRGEAHCLRE
jgi:hypothetical protein